MNTLCIVLAIAVAILFSAVNLFLPYALIVMGFFAAIAYSCGMAKRSKGRSCRLGLCMLLAVLAITLTPWSNGHGATTISIPPGEAGAKAALDGSPRHHEWADIDLPGAGTKIAAFVSYPERKEKAPVVIVIHEIYGLTDWIRAVADSLAAEGFIAIAPDMLSGKGPGGGGTGSFAGRDEVVKAVRELSASDVVSVLDAVSRYGRSLPAATEKFAVIGFCWGGAQSFYYATAQPDLDAAVVYYGTSPELATLSAIRAPVLGLYGEDDARVNTTVGPAEEKMKELGKPFFTHTYKGAGHGFLRAREGRGGANLDASRQAWPATIQHLKKYLE